MIISQIVGGLGNQMFQYAAARALALENNSPLLLDLRGFVNYKLHNGFELDRIFSAHVIPASQIEIRELLGWRTNELLLRLIKRIRLPITYGSSLVIEPDLNFWPGLKGVVNPSYLIGYWQSEDYFRKYEAEIRSDFKFKKPLTGPNLIRSEFIKNCQSVSIHVRRGDYLKDVATAKILKPCSIEYYLRSIELICELIPRPHFFVFSDDLDWVKHNLKINYPVDFISGNKGEMSYVDMQLMSLCKHHIIANSTFSWWGAWLNPDPNKIVIAPKNWFQKGAENRNLLPATWLNI